MNLGHFFGIDGGGFYNFYSGFAQAIGSITLLGGLGTFWLHKVCHVHNCHRLGRMKIEGSEWTVCHKHHPAGPATVDKITAHVQARLKESAHRD